MEQEPKLTISGYRGVWGKSLNEKIAFEFIRAFARYIKSTGGKRIIVGRDARQTGNIIFQVAKEAFEQENIEVVYAGIIPTPSILLLIKKFYCDGGIVITASHNPKEYNGLKFVMGTGLFATQNEITEIEKIRKTLSEMEKTPSIREKPLEKEADNKEFRDIHINEVLKNIDVELIKSKKFKVVLDPINSAGSIITQEFLAKLGCETHVINGEPDGNFAHKPEPLAINLEETGKFVKDIKPDIGFIQDPDADRLVLVNEYGEIILEELTVSLAIKNVLSRKEYLGKHENTVVNLSTTQVAKDITEEYGGHIHRTKVGESNVVEKMILMNAPIGGEGNGGVIYPPVGFFRDSLSGIGLILELLARENKKISTILDSLPKYVMKKESVTFKGDLNLLYRDLGAKFGEATMNNLDGLRFDWLDSSWIHIRPSNTEPIVRIIGEAKSEERINNIFKEARLTLSIAESGVDFSLPKR